MLNKFDSAGRWVVGTDGSLRADKAVMWAAKHASERKVPVPLLIIHVIQESPLPSAAAQDVINDELGHKDAVRLQAERLVQDVAARVHESYPDLVIETAVVRGQPEVVLAAAGADADQVVVGGSADHVVANAQGTVAVVPEHVEDRPEGPVVLGLDDSKEGRLAIARAFQAASLRGVPLIAMPAWEQSARGESPSGRRDESAIEGAQRLIADKVAEFPEVPVTVEAPSGRPEDGLTEASRTAGMVVIGSRGRAGFTGLRLGAATRHVLQNSYSPVVVTRGYAGWQDQTGRGLPVAAH
ncbi:MAG: universal stress protein [Micrococcales bacterium]|nr:universal stress protein [Micrococcales bacterium]